MKADDARMNKPMVLLMLTILVIYVTMVYGPIAALLVELFPTRIRYTSMSLPYHIGNGWFGGFLPASAFAIVAATGDIYSGLWYPDHLRASSPSWSDFSSSPKRRIAISSPSRVTACATAEGRDRTTKPRLARGFAFVMRPRNLRPRGEAGSATPFGPA